MAGIMLCAFISLSLPVTHSVLLQLCESKAMNVFTSEVRKPRWKSFEEVAQVLRGAARMLPRAVQSQS